MAQPYQFFHGPTGYSITKHGARLGVRFIGPAGKRMERMTRSTKADANYHAEAAKIIDDVHAEAKPEPSRMGWDEAMAEVERTATDLRPATIKAFGKVSRVLRETLGADATNPAAIGVDLATRFSRLFLAGTYSRSKNANAIQRKRKPITLASHLRNLSALWGHFRDLAIVSTNPWSDVRRPQVEKKRKHVPTDAEIEAFRTWLRGRYPQWPRLHAFIELAMLSACRLQELVGIRTNQLRDERVTWTAAQTKQKDGRTVLVTSPDLWNQLVVLAGPTYLWEGFADDLKEFRPSKNRKAEGFTPMMVYWVIGNIFREFSEAHPDQPRLSPHSLRRRAITMVTIVTQSVDATAQALGVSSATVRSHYLDAQRAFNTDEVFRRAASLLLATSLPQEVKTSENAGSPVNTGMAS
jgi:integrase